MDDSSRTLQLNNLPRFRTHDFQTVFFCMLGHSGVIVDHGPTMPSENMELYILRSYYHGVIHFLLFMCVFGDDIIEQINSEGV